MAWANPCHRARAIGAHERIDEFGCANGYTHAFQARYSDDIKLGFCKILFIELTETLELVVIVNVLDHKFASLSSEREVCLLKEQRHRPLQNQTRGSRLGSLYYDNKTSHVMIRCLLMSRLMSRSKTIYSYS